MFILTSLCWGVFSYQCCMTLGSTSCQPLDAHRKKQTLSAKWSLAKCVTLWTLAHRGSKSVIPLFKSKPANVIKSLQNRYWPWKPWRLNSPWEGYSWWVDKKTKAGFILDARPDQRSGLVNLQLRLWFAVRNRWNNCICVVLWHTFEFCGTSHLQLCVQRGEAVLQADTSVLTVSQWQC